MRTRSQPMSPSGYLALENHRASRIRSKKKATPQPSAEPSSSNRVTRSQDKKPDAVEQAPSAESEASDHTETTKPKSTRALRQKQGTSKKVSRRVGNAKPSASYPPCQQNLESVVIDKNATSENEEPESGRASRKAKVKSKTKSQRPTRTPVSRTTRSRSRELDAMEDNATTNGKGPESGRRPRRTRAASRATPQRGDRIPALRPDQADQTTTSEDEPLVTADSERPNATSEEITGSDEAQAEGKENILPKFSRKRPRSNEPEPVTPKRRNVGRAFSERPRRQVPFLERSPFRPLPLAERERRRQAERNGRLHSTLFHLPEYVSQAGANHQEHETRPPPLQQTEPAMRPDEPRIQPASNPTTPPRGWSIRGLLNSMPRSFSRFIPRIGTLAPGPDPLNAPEGDAISAPETPAALEAPSAKPTEAPAPFQQLHENRNVDQANDLASPEGDSPLSEADLRYRKRLEEFEKSIKREQIGDYELTYSLYPRPWDTRRFLESPKRTSKTTSLETPSMATPKSPPKLFPKPTAGTAPKSTSEIAQNTSTNGALQTTLEATPKPQKEKKRKRAPSPDVIPNPPGCSYGMDLDYFYIDDSDEDEGIDSSREALEDAGAATGSAIRSEDQPSQPPSKKVRFDASPQDSPSKIRSRARATEPYTGHHFVGVGKESLASAQTDEMDAHPATAPSLGPSSVAQPSHAPASADATAASGLTTAPAPTAAPGPIPAPTPATRRPMDAHTSHPIAPSPVSTPTQATTAPASDEARMAHATAPPPSGPGLGALSTAGKPEDEIVAKARSQVEKFKPKTPSALRTTSRYSSPLTISSDLFANLRPSLDFGDDQAGRDAQWLYEICPSGKMEELKWPMRQKITDSLDIDNKARQLLVKTWNNLELDDNHALFCEMVEESE